MKITVQIILSAALLGCFSCSEPKKRNVVDIRPGTPLFPSAAPTGTTANVNPPHGQPGHNCAIPVGAPLNSATVNTAPPSGLNVPSGNASGTPAPDVVSVPGGAGTVLPTPQVQVAPGTNPPHGQPGHNCSIPVGAPLQAK